MKRARVAVVGGGVSGLALCKFLRDVDPARERFRVELFDTGERACGGRLSSRSHEGEECDHGAQYVTLADPVAIASFARPLVDAGALSTWSDARVGTLSRAGGFEAFADGATRYVGVDGFRGVASALEECADAVRRPQWVGAMTVRRRDAKSGDVAEWTLASGDGARAKELGNFDFVVIAHNGKCAHRLASTAKESDGRSSCAKLRDSLRCAFGVRPTGELERENKLILSSVWSVIVTFEGALDLGLQGAHVIDGGPLSWVSNMSAKRRGDEFAKECANSTYVLQSTAEYARDNKVPQEAVPAEKALEVMETLVTALEQTVSMPRGSLRSRVKSFRAQLWGAANPLTVCNQPCVLDLKSSTAAIGDWCTSGPPCVESAVLSAYALAKVLDEHFDVAGQRRAPSGTTKSLDAARPRWTVPNGAASAQGGFPGTKVPPMREASAAPTREGGRGGGRGGRGGGRGRGGRGRGGRNASNGRQAPRTISASVRSAYTPL